MFEVIAAIAVLLSVAPLAMLALRLSKRYRRTAYMAASLLLIFGLSVKVDPPPPPSIEAVTREDDEAPEDEPETPESVAGAIA